MKRKMFCILLTLVTVSGLCGCESEETSTSQTAKTVKTQAVSEESVTTGYNYLGIVKAKETKNYSFLSSGKIAEICVEKGQEFKKGDVLAKLDTTTLEYSASIGQNTKAQAEAVLQKTISTYDTNISNAQSQIDTLEKSITAGQKGIEALEIALEAEVTNIEAAENALATLKNQLEAARMLNQAGTYPDLDLQSLESTYTSSEAQLVASQATHEGNKASLESKNAELDALIAQKSEAEKTLENLYISRDKDVAAAQADVESAGISNDITNKSITDAVVTADSDGYVMELPYKEGEVISAGYPVVVAKSRELVVTIGASDEEYKNIAVGGKALINGDAVGTVETIAQYPDETTRTYAVDIVIEGDYTIGETVEVKVVTGSTTGCYVPINAVFNSDGVDYVYAVDSENRLYKKQVVLGDFQGDKVEVQIDDPTAIVVTEGVKNLRENDLVALED